MGVGLSQALVAARSSMSAREKELNIIGQNVSNASRASYHRQEVVLENGVVIKRADGFYGTGVVVTNVTRSYNAALESSLRGAVSEDSYNSLYSEYLRQVESSVATNGTSALATAIQSLADSFQSVATQPEEMGLRSTLIDNAELVRDQFNQQYAALAAIRDDLADVTNGEGQIKTDVDKVNDLIDQLVAINKEVASYEGVAYNAQQANDLRDTRDAIVKEIASLADCEVRELNNGAYELKIGGHTVVSGQRPDLEVADKMVYELVDNPPHGTVSLTWQNDGSAIELTGGEIKGEDDARSYVTGQMDDLWEFAQDFAMVLNDYHSQGFDLNGDTPGADSLFDASTVGQMAVTISDPRKIAASNTVTEKSNGKNALAIWNAMNTASDELTSPPLSGPLPYSLNNDSLLAHSDQMADGVAAATYAAIQLYQGSTASVEMYQDSVQEGSGVLMDEELSYMLEVQRAYQASAKMVSVIDSMMETAIGMI